MVNPAEGDPGTPAAMDPGAIKARIIGQQRTLSDILDVNLDKTDGIT